MSVLERLRCVRVERAGQRAGRRARAGQPAREREERWGSRVGSSLTAGAGRGREQSSLREVAARI